MKLGGQRVSLRVEPPFELAVAVFGHGWIDLAPNRWDPGAGVFGTAAYIDDTPTDLAIRQRGHRLHVDVVAAHRIAPRSVRRVVTRLLRLDEDFTELWARCETDPALAWAARRGAGRLLRSAALFEDLVKLLLTTNCTWSATRRMVAALVEHLGETTPADTRPFPRAHRCATQPERFFRDTIRVGYRARPLVRLAQWATEGRLDPLEDPGASVDALRGQLLSLPGFGPYATGQALRLLGHYEDLALDSWCRAKLAARSRSGRCPAEPTIRRRYARYDRYRGLALWLDLTSHWHDDTAADPTPLATTPQ